jgi:hypothetical protein
MQAPPNGAPAAPLITPVMMPVLLGALRPARAKLLVSGLPISLAGLIGPPAGSDLDDGLVAAAWPAGARAAVSPAASEMPARATAILRAAPATAVKDICRMGACLLILPIADSHS